MLAAEAPDACPWRESALHATGNTTASPVWALVCCPRTANPGSCGMACAFRASPRRSGAVPALTRHCRGFAVIGWPGGRPGCHRSSGRACLCGGSGWQRCAAAVGRQVDSGIIDCILVL